MAQQNDVSFSLKNQQDMICLPQTSEKELQAVLGVAGSSSIRECCKNYRTAYRENLVVGPPCGLMDEMASACGICNLVFLSEMENALCKASGQVERANSDVRRLKVENNHLRQEMEAANIRAAESAASCEEVPKREKKTLMQFQSWEKLKSLFQEELTAKKRKLTHLEQANEQ
ncbi:Zinc finger, RING/FYVE/PHD-type [Artemisia annua]|uniref:Zinc finger, RING/FYVE/PHD-type n=1 Tax=Artemisia annua TaxID=35608 RepID=A0A2U1L829_ARTAN|nr:Zinc finger, RING/FYVE/PHD-type [Artemisia annua]